MAQSTQLVGIIELDVDPDLDAFSDDDLGQTLRRLRSSWNGFEHADELLLNAMSESWPVGGDGRATSSVVVVAADVGQLRYELQRELSRLMTRLLLLDS
jgi:hypothetical protein